MKEKTFCPYCGSANLVEKSICYEDKGTLVFQCHFCKNIFTDLTIKREQIEDLQTNQKNV